MGILLSLLRSRFRELPDTCHQTHILSTPAYNNAAPGVVATIARVFIGMFTALNPVSLRIPIPR
jgi:hypothetical protein